MASLQKNVSGQKVTFCLVSATTGAALTTATFTSLAWVTVDGTQAGFAGTFTTLGNGQFQYAPTQGETNGTDIGILIATSGAIPVNLDFHTDQVDVNGLQKVDVADWNGTAVSAPATAGIPDVNAKNINNVATTSVTTISANQGTTQAITFDGNNLPKVDVVDIAGTASAGAAGYVALDWSAVHAPTSVLDLTNTTIKNLDGNTVQTGDAYARLGAPAGASVSADVAAVKSDTGTILTDVNTGAGAIYSRLGAPAGASVSADIAAVAAKTTNLPASPAAVGSAMALTTGERSSVADALLDRDMSVGTDSGSTTVRTMRQALRFLRNKWAISTGTLTVYKEDDATSSWTAAVTTDGSALPIVSNDPAGP